jgi:hypothetical protein
VKLKNNQPFFRTIAIICIALASLQSLSAEVVGSTEWGFALDLPEGYALTDSNGNDRFHFAHELYPADLQIALYPADQFEDASGALAFVTKQLQSTGTEVAFDWRMRKAAIGKLEMNSYEGWAVALELASKKGWLVMACYSPQDRAIELEPLIISTLDGVFTDDGSYYDSGPMTTFAWPKEKDITVFYDDGKNNIEVPFNSIDAAANQSVVERESQLFVSYQETDKVILAWKRYYRMIWRDAWARLAKPNFAAANVLPQDPSKLAQSILSWTQSFTYVRNFEGADFTNLPEAFATREGDCDARSLLMVLMLNQMGVDAILLLSPEYHHAMVAVDCPGPGARFQYGNKKYLVCDTTAKVGIGLIAQDMADPSKWIGVSFYAYPQKEN